MPLSNMRSDNALPTAPASQQPSVHQGAGVTAPAMALPLGCISPSYRSCDEDKPGSWRTEPLETGTQTNSQEADPCPCHCDYSHSCMARDPGSKCLGAGRSPTGSPKLARAFLEASMRLAPLPGARVPLLLPLSVWTMPLAWARAACLPQRMSKGAKERLNMSRSRAQVHRDPTAPHGKTHSSSISMPLAQLPWQQEDRAPGSPLTREASVAVEGLSARNECLEEPGSMGSYQKKVLLLQLVFYSTV